MAEQVKPDELTVKSIDIAVDPTTQTVGVLVKTEETSPFMLAFSQPLARKLVNDILDLLKVLLDVSPPTKLGEQATVVEKWEIGTAFPDRVWFVLHSLAYGSQCYAFLPTDARDIAKQLETMADEVDREISSGPQH